MIRTVTATRYVTPLREGGSLPAVVEADDLGLYVLKFRGAGQGPRALVAELLAGEIGRALGLLVPELVFVDLDPRLGRSEPDPEIQALIRSSAGLNLALDFLPSALAYDPLLTPPPDPALASLIVWFDAYVTNVDRTRRNTNMLVWHNRLWLIDHGASLYFHHAWNEAPEPLPSESRFPPIRDHVLLPFARALREADAEATARLTPDEVERIVALVPDAWLTSQTAAPAEVQRAAYVRYLLDRLRGPRPFVEEAIDAHARLV